MSAGHTGKPFGIVAEFDTPGRLVRAARMVRDDGYKHWDCHSPFPVHGLNAAMGMHDTHIPWVILGAGATGAGVAILMQWWMNAVDYKLVISGKPLFSLPAQIPIAFELTILFAAVTAFVGMFAFNRLPRFHHPVFGSERFRRATTDRFFIVIEASDPRFDPERSALLLQQAGGRAIELLES